jgi:enterochelin esterase-like enzyme
MRSQTKILSKASIAMLILGGCASSGDGPATSGSGGSSGGTGGMASGTGGSGGTSSGSGGSTSGRGGTGGIASGTGGSGGSSSGNGGAVGTGGTNPGTGTGGSSAGGSAGTGSGGSGAAGKGGSGGAGGLGGAGKGGTSGGGTGGMRPFVKVETTVPTQYGNPVANAGKWTSTTYPAYYHGSGSVGQVITKQSTPLTKPVNIYTPPGYDPQTEYPLAFFLHGYPDNQDTWMQRAKIKPNVLLDNLIAAKIIKPIIGVWPMGSSTGNSNDTGGYMVFDNELMNDLIPFIEAHYSVKKDRDSRLMSGFSYGGMQTINVFLCHHLKDFGWFAGYSPAGGNYNSDTIASCLKQESPAMYPVNYFYIHSGSNELATSSAAASANGLTMKAAPTITSANFTYLVTGGGHDYDNCNIGLYNIVRIAFPY